jgi:ElaB/YqjD/DUF883 family membrane-anchored ribosome-binding protein
MAMMDSALQNFDQAKVRMAADFRTMIHDSEELLKAAANVSGEGFGVARSRFEERVKSAKALLAEASPSEYIHANPWSAVGIAAAAGLLLGFLAARR